MDNFDFVYFIDWIVSTMTDFLTAEPFIEFTALFLILVIVKIFTMLIYRKGN